MTETLKDRYFKYAHRCLDAAAHRPRGANDELMVT